MKQGPADTSLHSIPNSAPVHKARGRRGNALWTLRTGRRHVLARHVEARAPVSTNTPERVRNPCAMYPRRLSANALQGAGEGAVVAARKDATCSSFSSGSFEQVE